MVYVFCVVDPSHPSKKKGCVLPVYSLFACKNNIIMPIYILKLYRYIYTYKSMTKNSMCMCKTNKRQKI